MDVYLASGNAHKLEEFLTLLNSRDIPVCLKSAREAGGMPDVEESGETFAANALIKATALLERIPPGAWAIADDSGLQVDALDGAPGVYSARYAGPAANAAANNMKLLEALKGVEIAGRTARFVCVLCCVRADGAEHFFEGTCEGHIMLAPSGEEGFGYDPLFRPLGYERTFADLGSSIKNSLSHRARAIAEWCDFLQASGL